MRQQQAPDLLAQQFLSGDNQDGSQRQSGWMMPGSAGGRA
jgi:hypothetical protein